MRKWRILKKEILNEKEKLAMQINRCTELETELAAKDKVNFLEIGILSKFGFKNSIKNQFLYLFFLVIKFKKKRIF